MAIGVGGAVSAFAVFEAAMLWVSRMPFVLAREGYLPRALGRIWSEHEIPARSILLCCAVFTLLIPLGFVTLVVLDVFFYMFALMLEMWALVRLRRLYPNREGLFAIGGGRAGLYAVVIAPIATWVATFGLALSENATRRDFFAALVLAACVGPVYAILRHCYGGPAENPSEE
jgi:amino acid transporter